MTSKGGLPPRVYGATAVARHLGVSPETVVELALSGEIATARVGHVWLLDAAAGEEFIDRLADLVLARLHPPEEV